MQLKSEISKIISHWARKGEDFLFAINYNVDEIILFPLTEAAANGIYFDFEGKTNFDYKVVDRKFGQFDFCPSSFEDYKVGFDICRDALQRGDTYLINYTCKTPIITDYSQKEIFNISKAKFKLWVQDKFIVFSPERFVKISNGIIETRPMKGTINASLKNAESRLLEDSKEIFEHNTIVDLLRNDLNLVAKEVKVENYRYIERIKTSNSELLQASSRIIGTLKLDYIENLGDIIVSLLPAGSVTGAPKEKTIETINSAENYKRGFYTGIFGFHCGGITDMAVAIRFIEVEGDKFFYKSGGGITVNSKPKDEYQEMQSKIYVPLF